MCLKKTDHKLPLFKICFLRSSTVQGWDWRDLQDVQHNVVLIPDIFLLLVEDISLSLFLL